MSAFNPRKLAAVGPIDAASVAHVVAGLAAVAVLATATAKSLSLDATVVAAAASLYLVLTTVMWRAQAGAPPAGFGVANRATLARAALTCLLGGLVVAGDAVTGFAWAIVLVASVAAALDLADGWLARRHRQSSAFGARFDMETDALLILVLAALVVQAGQAGPWVLAAGLLRYVFVLAGLVWPALTQPLPRSQRRRAICAAQLVALIVCLAPIVAPPAASAIAAVALIALIVSFAVDTLYLARQAGERA